MTNTPEVLTECVADNALVLLLATMRRTEFNDKFVRAGNWLKGDALLKLDNVVLQPPVSSGTQWTRAAMGQLVVDNIAAFSRASPC